MKKIKEGVNPIIKKRPEQQKKRFKNLNLIIISLLILGILIGVSIFFLSPSEEEFVINYFTYSEVSERDFAINVAVSGVIIPAAEVTLRAAAEGIITELLVEEGQDVESEELLLKIDSLALRERKIDGERKLAEAKFDLENLIFKHELEKENLDKELKEAESNLLEAKDNLQLNELLYSYGSISQKEYERSKQVVQEAEAALTRAKLIKDNSLQQQEIALQRAEDKVLNEERNLKEIISTRELLNVKAPFRGRIIELNISEGEEVDNNNILITIANVKDAVVQASIDADAIDLIDLGHQAVIITSLREYLAKVNYIAPRTVDVGGTPMVETHLQFVEELPDLRPGTAVSVEIEVDRRHSPYLPRGPYLTSGQQQFVYVLVEGMAIRRELRYGMISSSAVEILSGLETGEKVITSSYDQFRHLEQIKVNEQGGRKI